jgi:repressor LexA
MNTSDRIAHLLSYSGLNAQAFAAHIGCKTKQSIYELLKGRTKTISPSMQSKILSSFPEVESTWLLTGEGQMLKSPPTQQSSGDNSPNVMGNNNMVGNTITTTHAPAPVYTQENAVRPIVPVELYKKPNTDIYNEIVKKPSSGIEYAQYFRSFSDFCMYMRVQGDAMSPNFIRGDLLALSLLNATYIINGTIYVLDTRSYGLVLRVVIDKGDSYECHSLGDEKRYAPFSIPKSDVIRIYQVMGLIRTCVS